MVTGNRDNAGTVLGSLIHWLGRWEKSASLRWSRLCARMESEGIDPSSWLIMAGKAGLRVKLGSYNNRGGGVLVEIVEGNQQSLLEYAKSAAVSTAVLNEIRDLVRDSMKREEKRIDELIAAVPKLIEDFRCDVAEEHLEQEASGAQPTEVTCACGHRGTEHGMAGSVYACSKCGCASWRPK